MKRVNNNELDAWNTGWAWKGQISCGRFNMVNKRSRTLTMTKRNVVLRWLLSSTPFSE